MSVIFRGSFKHDPIPSPSPSPSPEQSSSSSLRPSPTKYPLFSPVPYPTELFDDRLISIFVTHPAAAHHFRCGITKIIDLYSALFLELSQLPIEGSPSTKIIKDVRDQTHSENPSTRTFELFAKPFLGFGVTGPVNVDPDSSDKKLPAEALPELLKLQIKIFRFSLDRFTSEDPLIELLNFCDHYKMDSTLPLSEIALFARQFGNYERIVDHYFGDNTSVYRSPSPRLDSCLFQSLATDIERSFSVFERETPVDSVEEKIQASFAKFYPDIALHWSNHFSKDAVIKLFLDVTK